MRKYLLLALCLLGSFNIFGQIDIATSTVKVFGYWNENDSRIYSISEDKYVITGSDTTSREHVSYKVDIVIIDSSPNSYTIEWSYRDYLITTDNPLLQKLSSIYGNRKVIIKTDKKGSFIEVVNWKDFKKLISKTTSILKKDFPDLKHKKTIVKRVKDRYSTKEAIEKAAIQEIKQFYIFHGAKYKLDEQLVGQTTVSGYGGEKTFDAKYTLSLDEIDLFGFNSVIRIKQEVDSKQLTDEAYNRLSKLYVESENVMPAREDFPPVNNTIRYASRIHNEGWIVFSIKTEEISLESQINFKSRIIEIQK